MDGCSKTFPWITYHSKVKGRNGQIETCETMNESDHRREEKTFLDSAAFLFEREFVTQRFMC